jgi:hypothetical protein
MRLDDLAFDLLWGERLGCDLADARLAPASKFASRLRWRAELSTSTPGDLDQVARSARACIELIEVQLGRRRRARQPGASLRRAMIDLDQFAHDIAVAADYEHGEELLRKLVERFDRASFIATFRRRELRAAIRFRPIGRAPLPRAILPTPSVRVRQRGPSRQARPGVRRRTRAAARSPGRPADDPPEADLARRPSEQDGAA